MTHLRLFTAFLTQWNHFTVMSQYFRGTLIFLRSFICFVDGIGFGEWIWVFFGVIIFYWDSGVAEHLG